MSLALIFAFNGILLVLILSLPPPLSLTLYIYLYIAWVELHWLKSTAHVSTSRFFLRYAAAFGENPFSPQLSSAPNDVIGLQPCSILGFTHLFSTCFIVSHYSDPTKKVWLQSEHAPDDEVRVEQLLTTKPETPN